MFNRINTFPTPMKPEMAAVLVEQLRADDEDGNTYEVRDYQGGRKCIAIIAPNGEVSHF